MASVIILTTLCCFSSAMLLSIYGQRRTVAFRVLYIPICVSNAKGMKEVKIKRSPGTRDQVKIFLDHGEKEHSTSIFSFLYCISLLNYFLLTTYLNF
jgi:hypothetical protein